MYKRLLYASATCKKLLKSYHISQLPIAELGKTQKFHQVKKNKRLFSALRHCSQANNVFPTTDQ